MSQPCNHLLCHQCWAHHFGGSLLNLMAPAQVVDAATARCCFCGELTMNGVYRLSHALSPYCPDSTRKVEMVTRRRSKIESAKPYVPEHDFRLTEDDCAKLRQLLPEDMVQDALNRANVGPEASERMKQHTRSLQIELELYETHNRLETEKNTHAKNGDLTKVIAVQSQQINELQRELKRLRAVHTRELAEAKQVMAEHSDPTR